MKGSLIKEEQTQEEQTQEEQRSNIETRMLLCLDFDLTLTQTHMFHYVVEAINGGFSREDAVLRAIKIIRRQGPKGGKLLWSSIASWLDAGHGVAVTSYTSFPELPQALLSLGVSALRQELQDRRLTRWLSRPLVIFGDPAPAFNPPVKLPHTVLIPRVELISGDHGKNLHIQMALDELKRRGFHYQRAVLMDDDPTNIALAAAAGHLVIPVEREAKDDDHLDRLRALL